MDTKNLTIGGFQKHIFDRYEKVDRQRGTPKTFLWFIEEVGELATALHGTDRANLEEEFADVLAWLCTLANINDVDLAEVVAKKYLGDKPPEGHKYAGAGKPAARQKRCERQISGSPPPDPLSLPVDAPCAAT